MDVQAINTIKHRGTYHAPGAIIADVDPETGAAWIAAGNAVRVAAAKPVEDEPARTPEPAAKKSAATKSRARKK